MEWITENIPSLEIPREEKETEKDERQRKTKRCKPELLKKEEKHKNEASYLPRDEPASAMLNEYEKFKNPSNVYPNLASDNLVYDYVGSNGKQFVEKALLECENMCSVWPRNEDGSLPKCSHKATASVWMVEDGWWLLLQVF